MKVPSITITEPNAPIEERIRDAANQWANSAHQIEPCPVCGGPMSHGAIAKSELRILELELQRIIGEEAPRVRVTEDPPGSRQISVWQKSRQPRWHRPVGLGGTRTMKIELGKVAKDKVTGFEGVVVGRTEWLNGCIRYSVQSRELKDGVPTEAQWFDEDQLVEVKKKGVEPGRPSGGPCPTPRRTRDPRR